MIHAGSPGARQAGLQLRELLLRPGEYRRSWERHSLIARRDEVNFDAVAAVLADHLARHPETPADRDNEPRRHKDKVARALSGKMMSESTLELFIAAFGISRDDAHTVRALWQGSERVRFLVGARAVPPETAAAFGPTRHRTVSVHEYHFIGADGLPERHETRQVIEAIEDGLDRYPYRFDTDALTVEVGRGCRGLVGPLYRVGPGVYAVDIALEERLARQETTTLEYTTTFHYRVAPKPEFRRAAQRRIEGVNIVVRFHPAKPPSAIWWACWDGIDGEVVADSVLACALDGNLTVQRFVSSVEDTVVGFFWQW